MQNRVATTGTAQGVGQFLVGLLRVAAGAAAAYGQGVAAYQAAHPTITCTAMSFGNGITSTACH
ncbi:MAG: hypothetical protein WB611_02895 [Stellaceae bacterium]